MKLAANLLWIAGVCLLAGCKSVDLHYPGDGAVVGGPDDLVWASVSGSRSRSPAAVAFSYSVDGVTYKPLPLRPTADFGEASTAFSVDYSSLPSGRVLLKASALGRERIHTLWIDKLPEIRCSVRGRGNSAEFDCSGSRDPDGQISEYNWDFGDGVEVTSRQPILSHTYRGPGAYDVEVVACDEHLLCSRSQWIARIDAGEDEPPVLQDPQTCGCEKMILRCDSKKESILRDHRRRDLTAPKEQLRTQPAPLGPDPKFLSFNFEIEIQLKPNSKHALCKQGQRAERTSKAGAARATDAMKCTTECPPAVKCDNDDACDSRKCVGGLDDGKCVYSVEAIAACTTGGGSVTTIEGDCVAFPFDEPADKPADLGWDDYENETGSSALIRTGLKRDMGKGKVVWLDFPGKGEGTNEPYVFNAELYAFVIGLDQSKCDCQFQLTLDWDGSKFTEKTKITKIGGTCEVDD